MKTTALTLFLIAIVSCFSTGCPIVVTCEDVPCRFGEVCNLETGLCEDVVRDCRFDDDVCRSGDVCDEATGQCRPERLRCTEQFKSCPDGQACNAASGFCEPAFRCGTDADCGAAEQCNLTTLECEPRRCDPRRDDCPAAFVCGQGDRCLSGCRAGEESCPSQQFCLVLGGDALGRCVPNCRSDVECPFGQLCDLAAAPNSRCISEGPCSQDADCRADEVCAEGACIQPPCASDADCLASQICELAAGTCRDASCEEDIYGVATPSNHSAPTAFGLAPGEYTELVLCPGRSDWFAVEVRSTDIVDLRLRQHVLGSDLDLYAYDQNGVPIAANEQVGLVSSLRFAGGRSQVILVEVRGREFASATYDLSIATEFCPNDNFEENDSRSEATVIPNAPGLPSEIALNACGFDEDWFRINVSDGSNGLRIQRTAGQPDLRVDLFTPDGAALPVTRDAPLILLRAGATGAHEVRAFGSAGQSGSYRLTFEVLPPWVCPGAGRHATRSLANVIAANSVQVETFCPIDGAWEIDWVELGVATSGILDARVRGLEGTPPLEVALIAFDGTSESFVRNGVIEAGEHVVRAEVDPALRYFLRISSSAAVGRVMIEPRVELLWTVTP